MPANSPMIVGWATGVSKLTRGPQNISSPGTFASVGTEASALGPPTGSDVVSLGDGGQITLTFGTPIGNGSGADFAVFENGFLSGSPGLAYLELGFVEVSSDGTNFFRFAAVSQTPTGTQVGGFGPIDATNLNNLAGKHTSGNGTPFDLAELSGVSPLLDVNKVTAVRIIDVVGSVTPGVGTTDSMGNIVNDPFTTPFASGGFDLDAVAVINTPEPTLLAPLFVGALALLRRRRA